MQVTITNATSTQRFVSMLYKTLEANGTTGDSVTVSKSVAEMSQERQFLIDVENGDLTLSFVVEAGDSAVIGHPSTLESFATAAALPAASARPLFTTVWQVNKDRAAWTDGTDWRYADGVVANDI